MIKRMIIVCIIFLPIGCVPKFKHTEKSSIIGASTNIFSLWPGYKNRRITWLEFKVEEAVLQKRREELYYEMKELRFEHKKAENIPSS